MGADSTADIGDRPPSDLRSGDSPLSGDVQDEAPGSMEALSHCSALGVLRSGSPRDLLSLPWVRMHTASPSLQSGGCVRFHLDPFQTPSEGHGQMAVFVPLPLHTKRSLLFEPDSTPSEASGCGHCFQPWDGHCQLGLEDDMAC